MVSTKSPKYKTYRDQVANEADWAEAMAAEPRLIRRPIWRSPAGTLVGFNPEEWARALGQM